MAETSDPGLLNPASSPVVPRSAIRLGWKRLVPVASVMVFLAGGGYANNPLIGDRIQVESKQISCSVEPLEPSYRVGDAPALKVRIINSSKQTLMFPGSLDASERQDRYPHAFFTVQGPAGGFEREPLISCGWTNSLRAEDFVRVAPGERFEPYGEGFFGSIEIKYSRFVAPGQFFTFHYSTASDRLRDWEPNLHSVGVVKRNDKILDRMRQVPSLTLECSVVVSVRS